MNRTNVSNSGRGLVLVGGVTIMGISLALAQLGAQTRPQPQSPGRTTARAQPPDQEDQARPRSTERRETTRPDAGDSQRPADPERQVDARERREGQAREGQTGDGQTRDGQTRDGQTRDGQARDGQRRESRGPWLGVFLEQAGDGDRGAAITHVYPAGPAARAGFRAGDVIVGVNGQQVAGPSELVEAIDQLEAGKKTEFTVLRRDQEVKLSATLSDRSPFMFSGFSNLEPGQADEWERDHEHDEFYDIPEHAMELEAHRRLAEQHERIENLIQQLRGEVQALREELKTRR